MWENRLNLRWRCLLQLGFFLYGGLLLLNSPAVWAQAQTTNYWVESVEGTVLVARAGAQRFDQVQKGWTLDVGDRVRVGPNSQLVVRRADQSTHRFYEESEFRIREPQTPATTRPRFNLLAGIMYFFHRGKPGEVDVQTPTTSAATRGTEFNIEVDPADGTTLVTVIDGSVVLSNEFDTVIAGTGQQALVQPGRPPVLRAALDAINVIQWTLYYPGILDPRELPLTEQERTALAESLNAYEAGDLPGALEAYPEGRAPGSDAERVYFAALVLSVGQVEDAEPLLGPVAALGEGNTTARLADALRLLIATVKLRAPETNATPELATEWMAESYRLQSFARLEEALAAARNAVARSPEFGFAWARVGELEFSFGRIDRASEAIDKSLEFSPRNAQALALKGFLFAARNQIGAAIRQFNEAIEVDSSLANAWLGRGLARIRIGETQAGREDLLVATTLEPQRAFLRSYLGKAWAEAGERKLAEHELELAKQFDPRDPTAWLYSALLKQQYNRINEAIRDLEHAQTLNTNRAIYRSGFLLDQDRAVRSANLARIYKDAGMSEWSVREAGRAVAADYGNYSAHLFLANSYDLLRDPNRINLRYETPAESEYLIANLLAPAGAGILSPNISQQEYSRLFERDRLRVVSSTEYLSRGAWTQSGAQFGTYRNSSYSFDALYRFDPGQRPNNDFEERELRLQLKHQITAKDNIYFQAEHYEMESGDVLQYYDVHDANPGLRIEEVQEPTLNVGYHREWKPGVHTLFLAGRLHDRLTIQQPGQLAFLIIQNETGIEYIDPLRLRQQYESELEIYSAEVQQIWQGTEHSTIVGSRFQSGEIATDNLQRDPSLSHIEFFHPSGIAADQQVKADFERFSFYAYQHWQVFEPLLLIGGFVYDRIEIPQNFRAAPISDGERIVDQLSPKAGLIWTPHASTTIRAAYTRSLAGASIDQSLQLEPSQVAGINQSFRSLTPESVRSGESGSHFETYGFSLEQRLPTKTYLSAGGEVLDSERESAFGVFQFGEQFAMPIGTERRVLYRERSLFVMADQLLGRDWSFGARYRLTDAKLTDAFPEVLPDAFVGGGLRPVEHFETTLHQARFQSVYNHPLGFFGKAEALWYHSENDGYEPELRNEDFWHFNVFVGFRFPKRHAEVTLGIINITGQDYQLNPLAYYDELAREPTFMARARFQF